MSRVVVDLTKESYERLSRLAQQEKRVPPDQAAYIVEREIERLAKRGKIREAATA